MSACSIAKWEGLRVTDYIPPESALPDLITTIKTSVEEATQLKNVYDHLPLAPSNDPMFFFTLKGGQPIRSQSFGSMELEWRFEGWAFVPYLNNHRAEQDRANLIIQIIAVFGQHLTADGLLVGGQVLIERVDCDFGSIQGVKGLGARFDMKANETIIYEYRPGD